MVEDHVHHNLQSLGVGLVAEALVVGIRAEAWIHPIIIRGGIAVISGIAILGVGRVILENGCEPEGSDTEFLEVIEVFADAVEIAAMTETGFRAVLYVGAHASHLGRMIGTLCKTVGHQHVEHVGIGEAHALLASLLAGLQLIGNLRLAEVEGHCAGLGITEIHVDEQVVRRIEAHETIDGDTRIIGGDGGHITDIGAIDHQLHRGVLHPHVPVGRLDVGYYFLPCCIHCHYIGHQDGGHK